MKISVLGTGSIKRIPKHTSLTRKEINKTIDEIAKLFVDLGCEIIIIPDKGIPVEIAKKYKELGGKKLTGIVPVNDKKYGIKHIEENLDILDNNIEVSNWYNADGEIAAS